MKGKSEALKLDRPVPKMVNLGQIKPSVVVMGLVLLLLAAATAVLVALVVNPGPPSGIEAGIEASAARWSALGAHYAKPDYEAIASVNSARYEALARHYGQEVTNLERGQQANTARWVALGEYYAPQEKFVDTVWAYEEAFQAGDVDQLIKFYAPDAISLPPGFPASVGREAIEADLRWFFDEFELERDFALVDYEIAGNYATRLGEWTQTLTPRAGGDPIVETGRCIVGFEKMRGRWKVVWEIWNTYEPPAE
jgi:ketosteroid isomerase-like protein